MPKSFSNPFSRNKNKPQESHDPLTVQLKSPAQEFVDNHVRLNSRKVVENKTKSSSKHDSVDKPASNPNENTEKQSSGPPSDETDQHCKHFKEALQSFEDNLPQKFKTSFDIHQQHSWDEVIQEAKIAELIYKKKGTGETPFGNVRGFFRALQRDTATPQAWLEILPTQSQYASVICGGFKLLLRAASRMDEIREFIMRALATVPDEVEKAQLMIDLHQDLKPSQRLYDKVSELYINIFSVLNHIVYWFSQRSGMRNLKVMIQQGSYERELEEKITTFKASVQAVKEEADLCSYSRMQNIEKRVGGLADELADKLTGTLMQNLTQFLASDPKIYFINGNILVSSSNIPPPRKGKAISRSTLCEGVLGYDPDIPGRDLGKILQYGHELNLKEQDRVICAIEDGRFKNWLASPRSSALVINGNAPNFDGPITAMSFLAAHIINSVNITANFQMICLHWFTSEHISVRGRVTDVQAIMRSLIGQLVSLYKGFDLYFIKRSTAQAIRDSNDLEVLCNVFDELINQIPKRSTVFCVIDSLARLEYRHKEDVALLARRLHRPAIWAGREGSRFKLLLTHPGGAFRAASEFSTDSELVTLPESISGDRMGFNKLVWEAKAGEKISDLSKAKKK